MTKFRIMILIFFLLIVGIFVLKTGQESKSSYSIVFTNSDYTSSLYKNMENASVLYLENQASPWDGFLGAEVYICGVGLIGYDNNYIYGKATCMGYMKADSGVECEMAEGSGFSNGLVRFSYKNDDSGITITSSTKFYDDISNYPIYENLEVFKELFPGNWYKLSSKDYGFNKFGDSFLTMRSRGWEKFSNIYGCMNLEDKIK